MASETKQAWVAFPKAKYQEWHVGIPADTGTMKIALCPNGVPGDSMAEKESLARLIVTAVNFHERLVEALKFCIELGDCPVVAVAEARTLLSEISKAAE